MKKPAMTKNTAKKPAPPSLELTDAAEITTSLSGMMTDPITGDVHLREGDVEFSVPRNRPAPAKRKPRKQNRSRKVKPARPKQKRK
jgi:hypothetical protein